MFSKSTAYGLLWSLGTMASIIILYRFLSFEGPTGRRVGTLAYTPDGQSLVVGFAPSRADLRRYYTRGAVDWLDSNDFSITRATVITGFVISDVSPMWDDTVMVSGAFSNLGSDFHRSSPSATMMHRESILRSPRSPIKRFGVGWGGFDSDHTGGHSVCVISPNRRFWAFGSQSYPLARLRSPSSTAIHIALREVVPDEQKSSSTDLKFGTVGHGFKPSGEQVNVKALAFSPDSQHLVSGGDDGLVKFWRIDAQQKQITELQSHDGHTGTVIALAFVTPHRLLSVDNTGRLIERDWPTGHVTQQTEVAVASSARTYGAEFAHDAQHLVLWGDRKIQLIDPKTHRIRRTLSTVAREASCAAFSPDGTRVTIGHASSLDDWARGHIDEYDTTTGQLTQTRRF